jgi:hypothetical protein
MTGVGDILLEFAPGIISDAGNIKEFELGHLKIITHHEDYSHHDGPRVIFNTIV